MPVKAPSPAPVTPIVPKRRGRPPKKVQPVEEVKPRTPVSEAKSIKHREADDNDDKDEDLDMEEEDEEDEDDEDDEDDEILPSPDQNFKIQRLKLNVRMPTLPIHNPKHLLPPKKFVSFREWLENDDPLEGTDSKRITEKEAKREARMRLRVSNALQDGGVLSESRCSAFVPEPMDEPPRHYTRQDHMVAHALYFRKLMNKEHREHLATAKKLAHAAAAKWRLSQPEEIAKEKAKAEAARWDSILHQVIRDMMLKWDRLREEVNKRRQAKWEEEQQALGKKALNKVLEQSTQLLDRRRRGSGASTESGELDQSDTDDGATALSSDSQDSETEDEKNMSTSESGSEEGSNGNAQDVDEGLTVEELQKKYRNSALAPADIGTTSTKNDVPIDGPGVVGAKAESIVIRPLSEAEPPDEDLHNSLLDESDESVDMDDDMGDSDDNEDAEDSDDDGSASSEEELGLAGLLYSKAELVAAKEDSTNTGHAQDHEHEDEDEFDEVSLIPDATQVQTPSASNSEPPSLGPGPGSRRIIEQPEEVPTDSKIEEVSGVVPLQSHEDAFEPMDVERASPPATPISTRPHRTQIPSLLRGTLREYQHYGLDWLAGLYANGTNGILADEMGLGKTLQTISLLAHLAVQHEIWGPHLIVVPTSVMLNWEMEFKKFLPGFKILTYYGTQEERKQKRKGWLDDDKWNVCITSYQLVLQDQVTFKRRAWHYLVLDEAHNIKNFRSQRWQALLTFRTRARLLLTGTPLQNNLTELWSLMFFLMPSDSSETGIAGFANLEKFTSWFKKPVDQILEQGRETIDDEGKEIVRRLHGVLRPFLLRRLKADVEKQMPGKYEHVVYCKLSKRQRYLYDGFMSRSQTRETLARGNYLSIINCLMQLRKVCNHPDLFETRQIVTSFNIPKSVVADFEIKDLLVRKRLLQEGNLSRVNLDVVNLLPGANGRVSALDTIQPSRLGALLRLRQLADQQYARFVPMMPYDGSSVDSVLTFLENKARQATLDTLQHRAYLTSLRSQRRPLFSHSLMDKLRFGVLQLPAPPMPARRLDHAEWLSNLSPAMDEMVLSLPRRADLMLPVVSKFACVTPAAVASDVTTSALSKPCITAIRQAEARSLVDPFHEARMRLSIAFPDKRLLQYDCGKLQRLDSLLRTLQAGGHRALIFTQMTKVLDILEQFLNIHGHRYLRLDGATKIEQRQILTDRFNNDNRILAFILSSRSGGLGINLTGADTVIFYDLDWNPAMDKQCQDRCHRIGQTRDVHIYRFVSEYTIEANILRKANQKRMLDDVVIQEGDFTTDNFNKPSVPALLADGDDTSLHEGDAEASAAMDRVLGTGSAVATVPARMLEQAEDQEDQAAAKMAEKELAHADDADFDDRAASSGLAGVATPKTPCPPTPMHDAHGQAPLPPSDGSADYFTGAVLPRSELAADIFAEVEPLGVDLHIVEHLAWSLQDVPIAPPIDKVKKKAKKGGEHRVRRLR